MCFLAARNLREAKDGSASAVVSAEKGHGNMFKPNKEGDQDTHDLVTMDYTPASKNPPIHN